MVISNANWRLGTYYFLCKTPLSSALASRSEYFAHFIIVPITPPSSSFTISWHRFPLVALFMATVFNISRTSYIYNIYINIFRPFYQGQFGHAAFWVLGSLLGVGWFRASCHGTCFFPLIYVSLIMPTVRNNSISVGDMFRSLRGVSLEYTISVTSALISTKTCWHRLVSAMFGLWKCCNSSSKIGFTLLVTGSTHPCHLYLRFFLCLVLAMLPSGYHF